MRHMTAVLLCAAILGTGSAAAQSDPRSRFVDALGAFSLMLDGSSDADATRLMAALDAAQNALESWDEVIRSYQAAMAAEIRTADPPLAARMHAALGGVYLDRGRNDAAIRELTAARTLDPRNADAETLLGYAYAQQSETAGLAREAFGRASALDPENPVRAYVLARHLAATGASDEARRAFSRVAAAIATSRATSQSPAFISVALVPERAGVEPFFPPAHYADGYRLLHRGEYGRALDALRAAVKSDPLLTVGSGLPGEERVQVARIDDLMEAGDWQAALDAARALVASTPESGAGRYRAGRAHQRLGNYPEAIRELEASLEHNPLLGRNGILETIGSLYAARQEFDAAAHAYSRRIDAHPNDPDAHYDLGDIYLRQGRHADALAEFAVTVLLAPSHARAHGGIAQAYLREGNYEQAAAAARRAVAVAPDRHETHYVLGTALVRLRRADEGRRELEEFQRREAEAEAARRRMFEVEGFKRRAALSTAAGNHAETVEWLQKVVALDPGDASHMDLGVALLKAGRAIDAVEQLNMAARAGAPYIVHRHLAEAYRALGRAADAAREQASYDRIHAEAQRRRDVRE